ncbi:hypothetical protein PybrP1_000226 [[Pythium] brassicae (nom. inval.)]|nr:hypothetical protein PybrP1_000226 [[Pythium] brassicae (nom. inval.)]
MHVKKKWKHQYSVAKKTRRRLNIEEATFKMQDASMASYDYWAEGRSNHAIAAAAGLGELGRITELLGRGSAFRALLDTAAAVVAVAAAVAVTAAVAIATVVPSPLSLLSPLPSPSSTTATAALGGSVRGGAGGSGASVGKRSRRLSWITARCTGACAKTAALSYSQLERTGKRRTKSSSWVSCGVSVTGSMI